MNTDFERPVAITKEFAVAVMDILWLLLQVGDLNPEDHPYWILDEFVRLTNHDPRQKVGVPSWALLALLAHLRLFPRPDEELIQRFYADETTDFDADTIGVEPSALRLALLKVKDITENEAMVVAIEKALSWS